MNVSTNIDNIRSSDKDNTDLNQTYYKTDEYNIEYTISVVIIYQ